MITDISGFFWKSHIRCRNHPVTAPPRISHTLFSLNRIPAMAATMAITVALQSVRVGLARLTTTDAINPMALTLMASRKADMTFDALSRGMTGFSTKTKRKEGKNMAIVDTMAPG